MPKNIAICADGTGNASIKGRGTNVFKLYEAVDENGHRFDPALVEQVAIYHDGVGTEKLKWLRMFAGATGWGLSRNVKQLYAELARVYEPGDRIFLFGFSRGAFTVRTLAGLIVTCGIVDLERYGTTNHLFDETVRRAYAEYRRKYQTALSRLVRGRITLDVAALRARFSVPLAGFTEPATPIIDFIGVWDTVDAVGLPFRIADVINTSVYAYKFPDTTLSPKVARACHALAVDEARRSFAPVLWSEGEHDHERVEQVWFSGVHSNVGGGYPRQGMSLVALDWMMSRAEAHGLRFIPVQRELYRGAADVHDRLYDSRGGFGVFYRWTPRDVAALCRAGRVRPKVHRTVYERLARNTEGYAPGSLPPQAEVISTSAPAAVTNRVGALVARHFAGRPPLVDAHPGARRLGQLGYWLLVAATLACAALMASGYVREAVGGQAGWKAVALSLATTAVSTQWIVIAARTVWHHPWLIGLLVLSVALLLGVEQRLDSAYSRFWHSLRVELRRALTVR